MNERLVEDWLSKENERSYQTPFAQALIADGMQVLRVGHSSHEHGKDIIALDRKGKVHAYQLKDGNLDLKQFDKDFPQVTALVETQVEHPAITGKPRHQPWLVVSGKASMPVEDRIRVHNETWRKRHFTPLRLMSGMQIVGKLKSMAENFWPQEPAESRNLLTLYLADGKGTLDRSAFAKLIAGIVVTKAKVAATETKRQLAAANVFASYALSPFHNAKNHWELVLGWTITAAHLAWAADKANLKSTDWQTTFRLAVDAALGALDSLVTEALAPEGLGPGPFCELDEITRSRCTICVGAIAIKLLIELRNGNQWEFVGQAKQSIEKLFRAERPVIWGESAIPFFLAAMWALEETRGDQFADRILIKTLSAVATISNRRAPMNISSPYESADEGLAALFYAEFEAAVPMDLRAAASYTLGPLVTLAARRLWRNQLASLWSLISKIDCVQLVPDVPRDLLLRSEERRVG